MGIGFTTSVIPSEATAILADLWRRSDHRNRAMVARINAYLAPVTVDYDEDVIPLTPALSRALDYPAFAPGLGCASSRPRGRSWPTRDNHRPSKNARSASSGW